MSSTLDAGAQKSVPVSYPVVTMRLQGTADETGAAKLSEIEAEAATFAHATSADELCKGIYVGQFNTSHQ